MAHVRPPRLLSIGILLGALLCSCLCDPSVETRCTTDPVSGATSCAAYPDAKDDTGQRIEGTNIWLGNMVAASNAAWLAEVGITHIVSLIGEPRTRVPGIEYFVASLKDTAKQPLLPTVYAVHAYLMENAADAEKHRVLIHSAAGVSRSAAVAAGHLMLTDWTLDVDLALQTVKEARSVAGPNEGFLAELYELNSTLYVLNLNESARKSDYLSLLKEEL